LGISSTVRLITNPQWESLLTWLAEMPLVSALRTLAMERVPT
jgi:hypothetical protein